MQEQVRVLLIDDDPDQLYPLAELINKELSYEVITAQTVQEGMEHFSRPATSVNIVVTDMNFGSGVPEGGLRIIRHIQDNQTDYVPVIVMTAFSDPVNIVKCMEAGAFSYADKGSGNVNSFFQTLKHTMSRALDSQKAHLQVDRMAQAVCAMVDSHEPYTGGHSERVGGYAKIIAAKAGLTASQQMTAWRAGLVHDLAKVGIDAEVLSRPAKLSPVLMASIYAHPVEGYEMLKKVNANEEVAKAVLEHHKRINGWGYPEYHKALSGAISVTGQIVGLADSFDAMTTPRPYMGGKGRDTLTEALDRLKKDASNGSYDMNLVNCLESGMPEVWEIFRTHVDQRKLPEELCKRNFDKGVPGIPVLVCNKKCELSPYCP